MADKTPAELLAAAREKVVEARKRGFSDADIDGYLQDEIGLSLEQVADPKVSDYLRAAGMGLTLGFEDELAGLGAAIVPGGQGYSEARDDVRRDYHAAMAVAPKRMLAAEIAGSLPTALATAGLGSGAAAAGTGARALRAAGIAGAFGTAAGVGHSDAATVGGVAKDAAISGGISAVLGGGGSLLASGAGAAGRHIADAVRPSRAVVREAATQIPANAAATVARQEALAPGTAVLADLTPEMTAMARGIGADARTGVAARTAAGGRTAATKAAREGLGPRYEALQQMLPVDAELRGILGRAGQMPSGNEIAFTDLQRVRTITLEKLRATSRGSERRRLGQIAADLTAWLKPRVPELEAIDRDYAFLTKRLDAATKLQREVTNSTKNYAATRTYGGESGSVGGSLPQGSRGIADLLSGALRPDRAARARSVNELLLTPGDATDVALRRILEARARMTAGPGLLDMVGGSAPAAAGAGAGMASSLFDQQ